MVSPPAWSLVIHGGAGAMTRGSLSAEREAAARAGLERALAAGAAILGAGGGALDAVEAAVVVLEDDPHFNAGRGAVFSADGTNDLDAAIMDGHNRRAGAVARVTTTQNPVRLARAVMDTTAHVMLAGVGADAFALTTGLPQVAPGYFATPERRAQYEHLKALGGDALFDAGVKYGTVGAVARDAAGRTAAATSTGGLTGKRWGRIGDTPVIGAGTYADDRAGAVSATGSGEFFIRVAVAHEILARVRMRGDPVLVAAEAVVHGDVKLMGGEGGVIVAGIDGTSGWSFTTPGMYRGRVAAGSNAVTAIYGDEG